MEIHFLRKGVYICFVGLAVLVVWKAGGNGGA